MDQFEKFQDKIIICVDCKEEFVFPIAAQEYFAEHGFTEDPKRCRNCYAHITKRSPRGRDDEEGGLLVWQPKPFPPPPRLDHDRCGFGDDERWAK